MQELPNVNCAGFVGRRQQHMSLYRPDPDAFCAGGKADGRTDSAAEQLSLSGGGADKGNGKRLLRVVKGYLTQDGEITFHDVKRPLPEGNLR